MKTKLNFFKGVAFIAAAKYSGIIISIVISAILARLLSPSDFGIVAIATVFISFFYLLSDFGVGPAIIQFHDLTHRDISHIFGWSFWMAVILSFAFSAFSGLIADFYNKPILRNICLLLSIQIFFNTLNVVPNSLLMRDKKFNIVAYRNVSIQIFCGCIAIWGAYHGWGVYALLINPIMGAFLNLAVNEISMKVPMKLFPSFAPLKHIFSFSAFQFLFNFVNYFGRNLDKLIIGKTISLSDLGYYEKSYRLMTMPIENINGVFTPVLEPYLADANGDRSRILSVYNRMNGILISVAFPVAALLTICAREIILIVYGHQWEPAILPFSILAFATASQIVCVPLGSILQACRNTKLMFIQGLINVVISVTGLCIGAFVFKSIVAISIVLTITSYLAFINSMFVSYYFNFKTSPIPFFISCLKPASCFVVIFLLGHLIGHLMMECNVLLSLIAKGVVGSIVTYVYLQFFTKYKPKVYFSKLKMKIKNRP